MDMLLHNNTIKKIFREHFQGKMPIVKYGLEKKELILNIKKELRTKEGFKLSDKSEYRYHSEKSEEICCFEIISSSKYYRDQTFYLKFNDKNELSIGKRYQLASPVYHVEQIYTLYDKMQQEYKRIEKNYLKRENNKLKKQKITDLTYQAIIAKIHEIVKEDKFKFYIRKYVDNLILEVYLAPHKHIEIDIPYDKFQEVLKNPRITIQTIRDLHDLGISFQIKSYPPKYYEEPTWISYDYDYKN